MQKLIHSNTQIQRYLKKIWASFALILLALFFLAPVSAQAADKNPARTAKVAAGPYIIVVKLYEDPPYVDRMMDITVSPDDTSLRLQGQVTVAPGLGTEALPLRFKLSGENATDGSLNGKIRMPVRGAWDIKIQLEGPQGAGEAIIPVVVAAPGAIPTWLGWLIGTSPLMFIAFWIWNQHRYRNRLAVQ